jgi:hypothetical protein
MIGKTIKSLLSGDSTLTALVGTKIFPYVMNEDTSLPAVVYSIDSLSPEYNKGGWALDSIDFTIHSFSDNYDELQSVIVAVRAALELKRTGAGTEDINRIYLTSQDEGFDNEAGAFFNKLTFRVITNSY